jgi:RNA polymerase-binding transcription factor DksA
MRQYRSLEDQISNVTERMEDDGDWMEDSGSQVDLEMLQTMANRQQKHISDLENALLRIKHKNYGICIVTGQLIDKRRLMAVPTTTKSLEGKTMIQNPEKEERKPAPVIKKSTEPVIISRVIRPAKPAPKPEDALEEDDNYEDDDNYDDDDYIDPADGEAEEEEIDFDSFPSE